MSGKLSLCAALDAPQDLGQMVERPQTSVSLWCDDIIRTPRQSHWEEGGFVGTQMVGKSPQDKSSGHYRSPHCWTPKQPWPFPTTCIGPAQGPSPRGPLRGYIRGPLRVPLPFSSLTSLACCPCLGVSPSPCLSVLLPPCSGLPDSACHSLGHCVCACMCVSM